MIYKLGMDRNENGEYEDMQEPQFFYRLNLESASLEPIVTNEQVNQLQRLLEGSEDHE